jgi:hypothetical protein
METDSLVNRCVVRRNWGDTVIDSAEKGKRRLPRPFGAGKAGAKNVADGLVGSKKKDLATDGARMNTDESDSTRAFSTRAFSTRAFSICVHLCPICG